MDYSSTEKDVKPPKFGILCPINTNTFPGKLWKLVNDDNCNSVTWNSSGSGIFINPTLFKEEVLHCEEFSMFKTQNFSSFVRQLNLYGFRKMTLSNKVKQGPCISKDLLMHQFQHQCFIRSRPDLLHHVRRAGARRKHRDIGFGGDSENVSPSLLKRRDGVSILTHPFHGWGLPTKRLSGYSMYSQPYPLGDVSNQMGSYSPSSCPKYPFQLTSPLDDFVKPLPTITLQVEQHPYFRADSGQPCALSLTWMANTAKGSLTSGDFGTSPENLIENGRFRRFVLIPEESDNLSSGLKLPSPSYVEKFRPKVYPTPTKSPEVAHVSSVSHPISEEIFLSARETGKTTVARPNEDQTTVSWSTMSPKVTTEQSRFLYSNTSENASRKWQVPGSRQIVRSAGDADNDINNGNRNYFLRESLIDGNTGEIVVVAE
ncbi:Heat shock factor protein 5 [Holothuria leucospilota]|uniref:Heat shock factor protein 5 n=1 Tax=Holothuria leucospilota TaxID=206669 RepID=A0A9Q1CBK1_HOLLE|nr:Heat shock factor protein 5 [Holothuria leucospilota]